MTDPQSVIKHLRQRGIGHIWDDVSDLIIRPPRSSYTESALGPRIFKTSTKSKDRFERIDLELQNMRGMTLQASWYRRVEPTTTNNTSPGHSRSVSAAMPPSSSAPTTSAVDEKQGGNTEGVELEGPAPSPATALEKRPCVIYLHGNCGSRLDVRDCLYLLDEGMTVFALDFAGSGRSEGEYVSLGYYERQDLLAAIDYLTASKRVSTLGLWGRSMGAVTAVMYVARDPSISAIVCDSPFSSLKLLAKDLAMMHASWVPKFAVKSVVGKIRDIILRRVGFDIDDLDTLKYARMCTNTPAFIFHGEDDDFVRYEHSQAVAEHYAGNCIHHLVAGSHNSTRKQDVRDVARAFLRLYLIDKPAADLEEAANSAAAVRPPVGTSTSEGEVQADITTKDGSAEPDVAAQEKQAKESEATVAEPPRPSSSSGAC